MNNPASQTAYGPMIAIAVEQNYPAGQRLVEDAFAARFLPPYVNFLIKITQSPPARAFFFNLLDKGARGVWGGVLCRKRYIDDRLLEAVNTGLDSVVILGAGLDTHAYLMDALATIPVFEVDLPENIAYKKSRLLQVYATPLANVTYVPIDFEQQELASALASSGYRAGQKSFFILEAVTQYLNDEGIQNIFRCLSQARTGSRLVFTYVRKDFIDGTVRYGLDTLYKNYLVKRKLWHFGLEPAHVAAFLAQYGWMEREQVGSREFTSRYLQPIGRTIAVMEIERAVYAEKI